MKDVFHTTFTAWNCKISVEIVKPTHNVKNIITEIEKTLEEYEKTFSRFLAHSTISQLNQGKKVQTSPIFRKVLAEAIRTSKSSHGLFNPHINLSKHGYKKSFQTLKKSDTHKPWYKFWQTKKTPPPDTSPPTSLTVFPNGLSLTSTSAQLKKGAYLDFGGILKGYLSQLLATQYSNNCQGIIVNLGGDLATRGDDLHTTGFNFYIKNPITHKDEKIHLKNQSLSTSGSYKRKWISKNTIKNHLINPQTNQTSQSEIISMSFWGKDGALTDALSTASFFSTPTSWNQWLKSFSNLHYLAIKKDGSIIKK